MSFLMEDSVDLLANSESYLKIYESKQKLKLIAETQQLAWPLHLLSKIHVFSLNSFRFLCDMM